MGVVQTFAGQYSWYVRELHAGVALLRGQLVSGYQTVGVLFLRVPLPNFKIRARPNLGHRCNASGVHVVHTARVRRLLIEEER